MKSKINEGSSAGSVDIFFKISHSELPNNEHKFSCDGNQECEKKSIKQETNDLYVLIQNKYYEKEQSNPSKYDAPKIAQRAEKILKPEKGIKEIKIVLMVNDEAILDSKLKEFDKSGIYIIGINRLDNWFQNMLQDLKLIILKYLHK